MIKIIKTELISQQISLEILYLLNFNKNKLKKSLKRSLKKMKGFESQGINLIRYSIYNWTKLIFKVFFSSTQRYNNLLMFVYWLSNLFGFLLLWKVLKIRSHLHAMVFEASEAKNKSFHYHELTDIAFLYYYYYHYY